MLGWIGSEWRVRSNFTPVLSLDMSTAYDIIEAARELAGEGLYSDVLIVGGGIAGLATALRLPPHISVSLILKGKDEDSLSYLAQGGVAAAVGAGDGPDEHAQDTWRAGHGVSDPEALRVLTAEGPHCVEELMAWGVSFDRDARGHLALAREGAHSKPRILRCQGDKTGSSILKVLVERLRARPGLRVFSGLLALDLLIEEGQSYGVRAIDAQGRLEDYRARFTVLATGGAGQVFAHTTNPPGATGDGSAMAARGGVLLKDMEFVQFHPTALASGGSPLFLVSEAVRGEGAVLVDHNGRRFLPPGGELGRRDEVARAVYEKQRQGPVYLDATHLGDGFATRFPSIYAACRERGIDPRHDPIPVTPAAHFMMGGIYTDVWGQTSLSGLYAVGEAACTGVHGANRLASNSLLEGLVFSRRVALHIDRHYQPYEPKYHKDNREQGKAPRPEKAQRRWLQDLMWSRAGVIRHRQWLLEAEASLELPLVGEDRDYELANLRVVAQEIARGALARRQSLGAHHIIPQPEEGVGPRSPLLHE